MNKKSFSSVKLHWRRTKILATLGPASSTAAVVQKLIKAGVNVFRLNMSHADHQSHREAFKLIRKTASKAGEHVAILMDLCGPKIRTGQFRDGEITLKNHASVIITCHNRLGEAGIIPSQYTRLYKDVTIGERILLDDGNLELRVEKVSGKDIHCKVIFGGVLRDNKGINLPDTQVSVSTFTSKDKQDVDLAMELGADYIAQSFVRSAKDVRTLHNYMKRNGEAIPIIAKIEKPEAVVEIDAIIDNAYGIMIARGDLGIELPAQQVPLVQRELINKTRKQNKPVIVATQMLESMITHSRATRAEVSDVANAALQGADAVMLSAETSIGKYPVRAVRTMDGILREVEANQWETNSFAEAEPIVANHNAIGIREAISHAATALAHDLKLQGIIVPTTTGTTAIILSSNRPSAPLIGVSPEASICRRLALNWGVVPIMATEKERLNWKRLSTDISHRCKLTRTGNSILLVSGFNAVAELSQPVMKIIKV